MQKTLLTTFLLYFVSFMSAQNSIDLLTVTGRLATPQPYDITTEGSIPEGQEYGGMINLKLPLVLDSNNIIFNNLTYMSNNVGVKGDLPDSMAHPLQLNALIGQFGWIRKFSKDRSIQLLVVPRFNGDYKNVSSDNFQLGAIAMFEKRFSKKLKLKFGAMYNQEIAGPLLVPLLDIDWQMGGKWSLTGLAPIYNKLNYTFNDNTVAGIGYFGLITSYALGEEAYQGQYIERTSVDVYAFLRQRLAGNFHFEGRAGYTLGRKYVQYKEGEDVDFRFSLIKWGDDREPVNVNFSDGMYFEARLVYNLPLD